MAALAEDCMLNAVAGVEQPALVLDIDETALSNYEWMKSVDFLRDSPFLHDLFTGTRQHRVDPADRACAGGL